MNASGKDESEPRGWYVLTGRPCSGISTTLSALAERGYRAVKEAARSIIDERIAQGRTIDEIRSDDWRFQRDVLERKVDIERELPVEGIVFLDRAVPDSIVYYSIAGLDAKEAARFHVPGSYRTIFLMEALPYAADYARTESDTVLTQLERGLRSLYRDLGYEVVAVPVGGIEERVEMILRRL